MRERERGFTGNNAWRSMSELGRFGAADSHDGNRGDEWRGKSWETGRMEAAERSTDIYNKHSIKKRRVWSCSIIFSAFHLWFSVNERIQRLNHSNPRSPSSLNPKKIKDGRSQSNNQHWKIQTLGLGGSGPLTAPTQLQLLHFTLTLPSPSSPNLFPFHNRSIIHSELDMTVYPSLRAPFIWIFFFISYITILMPFL